MWNEFGLDQDILDVIEKKLKLESPTTVQEKVLSKMNQKCDIFAASRTGTGKTFCFVLPILNDFLKAKKSPSKTVKGVFSLVIAPTRELAVQIMNEFKKFKVLGDIRVRICSLLGGLSREKQLRIIEKDCDIVIATVGRLQDLIQNEDSKGLKKLGMCQYLVIDEVDRLIELGQFKEMKSILTYIDTGIIKAHKLELLQGKKDSKVDKNINLNKDQDPEIEEIDTDLFTEENVDLGVEENVDLDNDEQGLEEEEEIDNTEADAELVNKIESAMISLGGQQTINVNGEMVIINDELTYDSKTKLSDEEISRVKRAKTSRKTMLFSATLTQISGTSRMMNNKKLINTMKAMKNNKNNKQLTQAKEFPKIFDIMRKIRTNYPLEIVNCTEEGDDTFDNKMEIVKVKCIGQEKMLHLYYFLESESPERTIVFCNSIRSSRQVLNILKYCGIEGVGLHSHMQQRQRLKKIEQFKSAKKFKVLVTTDVASRGLHIEGVDLVIHFHTPRDFDTFVHRSGRTARMGNVGKVIMLEDADDRGRFQKYKRDITSQNLQNIGKLNL